MVSRKRRRRTVRCKRCGTRMDAARIADHWRKNHT